MDLENDPSQRGLTQHLWLLPELGKGKTKPIEMRSFSVAADSDKVFTQEAVIRTVT